MVNQKKFNEDVTLIERREALKNALKNLFKFMGGKLTVKAIEILSDSPLWANWYGEGSVKYVLESLKSEEKITQGKQFWRWRK